jgi:hypothetical protein
MNTDSISQLLDVAITADQGDQEGAGLVASSCCTSSSCSIIVFN